MSTLLRDAALVVAVSIGGAFYLSHRTAELPAPAESAVPSAPSSTPDGTRNAAPRAPITTGNTITLHRQRGQFWATGTLNGGNAFFLVDTGASLVALTPDAARAAGIEPANLALDMRVATANGTTLAARVTLDTLAVGPIVARDVEALVVPEGLSHNLLGMSFLSRLQGYSATPDTLTLTL